MSYHGSSIIGRCDGPEPLLTCCVPAGRSHCYTPALRGSLKISTQQNSLECETPDFRFISSQSSHTDAGAQSGTHQICSLIFFPSNSIVRILKSIPERETTVSFELRTQTYLQLQRRQSVIATITSRRRERSGSLRLILCPTTDSEKQD